MKEKDQELTPERKKAIREMVERYYGVKLGPDTPEKEERKKELVRLWNEHRQKVKQSSEGENAQRDSSFAQERERE